MVMIPTIVERSSGSFSMCHISASWSFHTWRAELITRDGTPFPLNGHAATAPDLRIAGQVRAVQH
jgi:hypothetical protein